MELIDIEEEASMRREDAAAKLRAVANQLSKHNEVAFTRNGIRHSVKVPNEVTFSLEIELGDDGNELEIEIRW